MHCDTSSKPRIPLHLTGHPRSVHVEALRFIRGIRGPRQASVTRKQIGAWLFATPAEFVDVALVELIAEGKITAGALSLRTPRNSTKRAVGYEAVKDNETGNDIARWWFFDAPDNSDMQVLEDRIDRAIADAVRRGR